MTSEELQQAVAQIGAQRWQKAPMWKKRLNGFASYTLAAWVSLFYPIEADMAMYKTLREQFEKTPNAQVQAGRAET